MKQILFHLYTNFLTLYLVKAIICLPSRLLVLFPFSVKKSRVTMNKRNGGKRYVEKLLAVFIFFFLQTNANLTCKKFGSLD